MNKSNYLIWFVMLCFAIIFWFFCVSRLAETKTTIPHVDLQEPVKVEESHD